MTNLTVHPERIVSLSPSNTEILFAVGAGPNVVGVTDYCDYPPELEAKLETNEVAKVGGYWNPSIEDIVNLKPDLVVVSTAKCSVKTNECKLKCSRRCEVTVQAAAQLRKQGINVLILAPHSINDVLDNIIVVGKATGNTIEAGNFVEKLKQRIDTVTTKSKNASHRPRVYFEVWNDPYISVNSGTWIGNVINLAGGTNVFGEAVSEWPTTDMKDVVQRNPDIIVFPIISGVPRFWGSIEEVKKRPGWKNINAVRNGSIYEIPRDFISRPGPRLVDALEMMTQMIHPSS